MRLQKILLVVLAITALSCKKRKLAANTQAYNGYQYIVEPKGSSDELKNAITDVQGLIFKASGYKPNTSASVRKNSIVLKLNKAKPFEERIDFKTSSGNLTISGNSYEDLKNGLYIYLRKVGFRWYFPGDKWLHTPVNADYKLKLNETVVPDFEDRSYFGAGGMMAHGTIDPQNKRKAQWDLWQSRNGFHTKSRLKGHAGQSFNSKEKALLVAHPEYRPLIDGKRIAWYKNIKYCISNSNLRKAFVANRIEAYEKLLTKTDPTDRRRFAVGVEPADGGKHCTCNKCEALGSISNRVFLLANDVAKELAKKYPLAKVNLLAYGFHSAIPDIELHPNVYVVLVPYGFQNSFTPEQFIEKWSAKTKNIQIYDYFNTTIWAKDEPKFDWKTRMPEKIRFWHANGAKGAKVETSFSIGSMGLGLYFYGRLLWDVNTDMESEIEEFYELYFGSQGGLVKEVFESWSANYQGEYDLPMAYSNFGEALQKAESDVQKERIKDLITYVKYLEMYSGYKRSLANKTSDSQQKGEALIKYMWSTYNSNMVHTTYLTQLFYNKYHSPNLKPRYDIKKKYFKPSTWKNIKTISNSEIEKIVSKTPKVSASRKTYSQKSSITSSNLSNTGSNGGSLSISLTNRFEVALKKGDKYTIRVKRMPSKRKTQYHYLTVVSPGNEAVYSSEINLGGFQTVTVTAKETGIYNLHVRVQGCMIVLDYPKGFNLMLNNSPKAFKYPQQLYILVPAGVDHISFQSKKSSMLVFTQNGKIIKARENLGNEMFKLPVQKSNKMQFISLTLKTHHIKLLNIPNAYYLTSQLASIPYYAETN